MYVEKKNASKHPQMEKQLQILNELGFEQRGKNISLLIRCRGDLERVIDKLVQGRKQQYRRKERDNDQQENIQQEREQLQWQKKKIVREYPDKIMVESQEQLTEILHRTQVLIIDCNNVMFADRELMKKYNYRRVPKIHIMKRNFKKIIIWCSQQNNLKEVRFVWDNFNFGSYLKKSQNAENNIQNTNEQYENIQNNFIQQIEKAQMLQDQVSTVQWTQKIKDQQIEIRISSAKPKYKIADDQIVAYAEELDDQTLKQTTFITSDRELTRRLFEQGADKFIGNGTFCRMIEGMKNKMKEQRMQQ